MNREETSSRNAWRRVNVEDVCTAVSVGIVVQPTQYYVVAEDGVRAFRSANVGENRIILKTAVEEMKFAGKSGRLRVHR